MLPACIVGSGLAGAMSMAFGCTTMAPHGGIFVVPVMGNAVQYVSALVVGTVVSAVLLGVLKKKNATMDVQTGSNIGCGMNGNPCLEKICRYNRVIVKVMNSNIIVNSD